jgi:O-methyltransferase domain
VFVDAGTLPKARGKGDVYLLRLILHDWDDEQAVKILSSVHQAIGDSGATLLILDVRRHIPLPILCLACACMRVCACVCARACGRESALNLKYRLG